MCWAIRRSVPRCALERLDVFSEVVYDDDVSDGLDSLDEVISEEESSLEVDP